MSDEPKFKMAIDPKRKQVCCVILQAIYGGERRFVHHFNDWLVNPTDDIVMVEGTAEQWQGLAKEWNK